MKISVRRLFSPESGKGSYNYLNTQKKYELAKTVLFFGISLAIFFMGLWSTKTTSNYLTIVAVLGCLPASKWAVTTFMYWRYKSLPDKEVEEIEAAVGNLGGMYDMVFTSYEVNYHIHHLVVCDNCICGYSTQKDFDEKKFYKHILGILRMDGFKDDFTIKVFTDKKKYTERLKQLNLLDRTTKNEEAIKNVLKSVSL